MSTKRQIAMPEGYEIELEFFDDGETLVVARGPGWAKRIDAKRSFLSSQSAHYWKVDELPSAVAQAIQAIAKQKALRVEFEDAVEGATAACEEVAQVWRELEA